MKTAHQLISDYCLKLVNIDAADWYLNPEFTIVLQPIFYQYFDELHLVFDASMQATLSSDTPPHIDFFLSLPAPKQGTWAVYVVVFVDSDGVHHLYIGSGTNATAGVTSRTRDYANKTRVRLPRFVRLAFDRGYELLHIGMLCWTQLPQPTQVPRARLLFLCLEAAFTCIFYTAFCTIMEPLWSHLMPWTRDSVSWGPLNSHLPLSESVGESLNLTSQQLQAIEDLRKERTRKLMVQVSKAAYDREREKDLEGFLARKRTEKAAWAAKNPEKVAVSHAKTVAKIKTDGRYRCNDCSQSMASSNALARHLASDSHAQQVALNLGAVQTSPSKATLRVRKFADKTRKEKKYYCSICDHNATGPRRLEIHQATKGHLKKVEKAAALAAISSI